MQNLLTNWKNDTGWVVIIALSIASMFGIHIPGVEGNQSVSIARGHRPDLWQGCLGHRRLVIAWIGWALSGVVKLLGVFTQWLHDRRMLDAKASRLPQGGDSIQCNWKALKAREDIRRC